MGSSVSGPPPAWSEGRKTATVIVCDLVGSTPLAARLDPETFRRVIGRFFAEARQAFERHEGTVQEHRGDAVVAAFGVPILNEDDALRAVLAADDLRSALVGLNAELRQDWDVRLEMRIGINTGEVAVEEGGLVLGDTANVAARLQQAAAPGEILVGEQTRQLVRRVTTLEQVPGVLLKGKELPVGAWRLLAVDPDPREHARRLDVPMVGRELELELLQLTYRRARMERSGHLVVVLGEAGVGKTRLINEFESQISVEAIVLKGRCPQYGQNIDYWPLLQVVRQAAGIRGDYPAEAAMARLASLAQGDETVAGRLAQMLDLERATGSPETASWALSRLIELLAQSQPVVLVLDDLQWAKPALLHLLAEVADRSRGAPVLLVGVARSELRHDRTDWNSTGPNVTSFTLEPLSGEGVEKLIGHLLDDGPLDLGLPQRLARAVQGIPLFAEELVAMLRDQGALTFQEGRWTLTGDFDEPPTPPNIETLLAARLERLSPAARAVIGSAAVIGPRFLASEVAALASLPAGEPTIPEILQTLVKKELLRRDSGLPGADDTYWFRHALIHDSAYRALAKETRAQLHERYADWVERSAGVDTGQVDETLAHHLKAAYDFLVELGHSEATISSLRLRAGERLAAAGLRAARRGDTPAAAATLLGDALTLLPPQHEQRLQAQFQLAETLREAWLLADNPSENEWNRLLDSYQVTIEAAHALGEGRIELLAQLGQRELVWFNDLRTLLDPDVEDQIDKAIQEFEWLTDDLGLARAWHVRAYLRAAVGRSTSALRAVEHAIRLAERIRDVRLEARGRQLLCFILDWGPTPNDEVVERVTEILQWASSRGMRSVEVDACGILGRANAMLGDFAAAWRLVGRMKAMVRSSSEPLLWVSNELTEARIHLLADEPARAEPILRGAYTKLKRTDGKGPLPVVAGLLARVLLELGHNDEPEQLAMECEVTAPESQSEAQITWREVRAVVLARRGQTAEAEELVRSAITKSEQSEQLNSRAQALADLGEVLRLAERPDHAAEELARAQELWEQKGNRVSAARAQAQVEKLRRSGPAA
jgi:class 3 adenylate cyclase/tetratricopeptide (TPR) repeat protein